MWKRVPSGRGSQSVRFQYSKLGQDVIGRWQETKGLKLKAWLDNADRRRLVRLGHGKGVWAQVLLASASLIELRMFAPNRRPDGCLCSQTHSSPGGQELRRRVPWMHAEMAGVAQLWCVTRSSGHEVSPKQHTYSVHVLLAHCRLPNMFVVLPRGTGRTGRGVASGFLQMPRRSCPLARRRLKSNAQNAKPGSPRLSTTRLLLRGLLVDDGDVWS